MKKVILIYDGEWHSLVEVEQQPGETRYQVLQKEAERCIAGYFEPHCWEIGKPTGECTPTAEIEIKHKDGSVDCRIIYPSQVGE